MDAFGAHRLSDDQLLCDEYLAGDTPGAGNKYSWHKYFYTAGRRVGNIGNNGAETVDYASELKMRESSLHAVLQAQAAASSSGAENDSRFKRFAPSSSVDFDENYQPINLSGRRNLLPPQRFLVAHSNLHSKRPSIGQTLRHAQMARPDAYPRLPILADPKASPKFCARQWFSAHCMGH